jgi:hypothetical protein
MKRPKFKPGDTVVFCTPACKGPIVSRVEWVRWNASDSQWLYSLDAWPSMIPESELQSFKDAFPCEPAPATPPLSELLSWG